VDKLPKFSQLFYFPQIFLLGRILVYDVCVVDPKLNLNLFQVWIWMRKVQSAVLIQRKP